MPNTFKKEKVQNKATKLILETTKDTQFMLDFNITADLFTKVISQ